MTEDDYTFSSVARISTSIGPLVPGMFICFPLWNLCLRPTNQRQDGHLFQTISVPHKFLGSSQNEMEINGDKTSTCFR